MAEAPRKSTLKKGSKVNVEVLVDASPVEGAECDTPTEEVPEER